MEDKTNILADPSIQRKIYSNGLQKAFNDVSSEHRKQEFSESEQVNLGQLLNLAETIKGSTTVRLDITNRDLRDSSDEVPEDTPIVHYTVCDPDSWRGIYAELAFTCTKETEGNKLTINDFIKLLDGANGTTYRGYKGGDFTMHRGTPVWICWGYGCDGGPRGCRTGVTGLELIDGVAVIKTADIPDKPFDGCKQQ